MERVKEFNKPLYKLGLLALDYILYRFLVDAFRRSYLGDDEYYNEEEIEYIEKLNKIALNDVDAYNLIKETVTKEFNERSTYTDFPNYVLGAITLMPVEMPVTVKIIEDYIKANNLPQQEK